MEACGVNGHTDSLDPRGQLTSLLEAEHRDIAASSVQPDGQGRDLSLRSPAAKRPDDQKDPQRLGLIG
jgi:hypothetical protein